MPVVLGDDTEPEPDLTVLRRRALPYKEREAHAEDVLLLIEVADSSLAYDRTIKRRLYAEAGRAAAGAVGLPPPEAGTFLFLDAAPFFRPGEALDGFLGRCLEAGVLLTPGPAAGRDFPTSVRLCFTAVPPADLQQALSRLAGVLRGR
jgi:aspartate/methionine/tyrosine aminotransferase